MILSAKADFSFSAPPMLVMIDDPALARRAPEANRGALAREPNLVLHFRQLGRVQSVRLPEELGYLASGDIVRVNPQEGAFRVLYRRQSRHNVLFFTDRCNSRCLMCSQPPRPEVDDHLLDDILSYLPWMDEDTPALGITGGEPTLSHERLTKVIAAAKHYLPRTALHVLSNGRLFIYPELAAKIAAIQHPDLMIGIPLYGDIAQMHDFVVQARGAFDQTLRGMLNLAAAQVPVEIRIVIHRQSLPRLRQLGRFIARNLPFVDQVVLMALEPTGYARSNWEHLWIDPADYAAELSGVIEELEAAEILSRIYNHPLCLLPPTLRRLAARSISDWKNIFLPVCKNCCVRFECSGLFASAERRHSATIRPI
jgi:His-Xaa-Ser system radical SAM maturase HxsC